MFSASGCLEVALVRDEDPVQALVAVAPERRDVAARVRGPSPSAVPTGLSQTGSFAWSTTPPNAPVCGSARAVPPQTRSARTPSPFARAMRAGGRPWRRSQRRPGPSRAASDTLKRPAAPGHRASGRLGIPLRPRRRGEPPRLVRVQRHAGQLDSPRSGACYRMGRERSRRRVRGCRPLLVGDLAGGAHGARHSFTASDSDVHGARRSLLRFTRRGVQCRFG